MAGRMPVRAGLHVHVLAQRRREARHPEALEEVDDALVVFRRMLDDRRVLLRPAARGQHDIGVALAREYDLGDCRKVELEPALERLAFNRRVEQQVVDEEEAAGTAELGQHAARTAAREHQLRQVVRRIRHDEFQRRIVERNARIERLAAEVAKGVRQAILDRRQTRRVQLARAMQIEDRQ